ncbi:unnamed protein product [Adineta steineri]|uniref:Uncharacterized protein n=1 Tax=Adineta steineri TaxID=433720 RepID=A0A815ICI2_9BILA|nr:unnamed protein product [Adineta steineri]CAF1291912.1 unnamed protein product [Adineta steineri]CAF1292116.1 unnamed protein product [Adineta steineri]CAF1331411.1 unnamed protein product [Adineta steineri]CAF1364162.1 unnamed protein product [Adineta steineri]
MSIWFIRFLIFIIVCLSIAHAYPSSMNKHKWLQGHVEHQPHAAYELLPESTDSELIENDGIPPWLYRSRKFCCAPPL